MDQTHNTLSENIRAQSIELLNKHLTAAIDLHGQLKRAHWNVGGPGFMAIHELCDKVSGEAETYSEQLAERAEASGPTAVQPNGLQDPLSINSERRARIEAWINEGGAGGDVRQ